MNKTNLPAPAIWSTLAAMTRRSSGGTAEGTRKHRFADAGKPITRAGAAVVVLWFNSIEFEGIGSKSGRPNSMWRLRT